MRLAAAQSFSAERGVRLHDRALVRPGSAPKTSSAKVRREVARRLYRQDGWNDLLKGEVARVG